MSRRLDPGSGLPLYLQVARLVREDIATGVLSPGDDVPSLRAMASQHRINIHTVAKAYQVLERDGLLTRRRGEPYRVAAVGAAIPERLAEELLAEDIAALVARAHGLGVGEERLLKLLSESLSLSRRSSA